MKKLSKQNNRGRIYTKIYQNMAKPTTNMILLFTHSTSF